MAFDGPIVVCCRDEGDPLVADLAARCDGAVLPAPPDQVPALIDTVRPCAVVVLDEPGTREATDALTATLLGSEAFVPVVRRWSAETGDPDSPATLWVAADADAAMVHEALQRTARLRTLLLEARRRHAVLKVAAAAKSDFAPPHLPDPWCNARDACVLVLDTGLALPRIAPTCAARGFSMVGAPNPSVASSYLELRPFDVVVIGPGIEAPAAADFMNWLRDDPRWRDLPVIRLADDPEPGAWGAYEATTVFEPRLPAVLFTAARLRAVTTALGTAMSSMDVTGLADPETGLLWPEAFRAGLAQAMTWARDSGTEPMLLRIAGEAGGPPLPASVARLSARLLRRADLLTRFEDGTVLALLAGADRPIAERVVERLRGVIGHTAMATGGAPLGVTVELCAVRPTDTPASLMARLGGDGEPARLAG